MVYNGYQILNKILMWNYFKSKKFIQEFPYYSFLGKFSESKIERFPENG